MANNQQSINAGKMEPQPAGQEKARVIHGKAQGDALESAVRRAAGMPAQSHTSSPASGNTRGQQAGATMQSAASLSRASDDQSGDGRFTIAEEQNFDQQSDQARRVGQMPEGSAAVKPADAIAKSMRSDVEK